MSAISGQTQDVSADWSALRSAPFNVLYRKYGAKGNGVADDTGAVQSAVNDAASAAQSSGIADVLLPAGKEFALGQISVPSGVRLWCYGALINPILSEINQALFYWGNAASLNRFEIRGGIWQGVGTEGSGASTQFLFEIGFGGGCNDVLFRDLHIQGWGQGPLYIRNPLRARAKDCTLQNTGAASPALYNSINFVVDGSFAQGQDMLAEGNIVEGSQAAAIAYVNANNSGSADARFTALGNICTGLATGSDLSGAIDIELAGTAAGTFYGFVIAQNHIRNPRSTSSAFGVVLGQASMAGQIGRASVIGNTIDASTSASGIGVEGWTNTGVIVAFNHINAPTPVAAAAGGPVQTGNLTP